MKQCPKCSRTYTDETLNFCLEDGEWLVEANVTDEPATAVMPEGVSSPGKTTLERETQIYTSGDFIAREVKQHKLRTTLIAAFAIFILAGFGYGIYHLIGRRGVAPITRTSTNILTERLSGDGRTRSPVISPDGKFMVYVKLEGGQQSLWIKQIQTGSNVNVVKPGESDEFWGITFSRDGNFVYYNAGGRSAKEAPTIFRAPTLGGIPPIKFLSNAFLLDFSPDGKQIAYRRVDLSVLKETVLVANADGSQEREVIVRNGTQYFSSPPRWSPDGMLLAVGVGDDALAPAPNVVPIVVSIDSGTAVELGTKKWEKMDDIVWHPSGDSLLVDASENALLPGQIWELSYPAGEPRKITSDVNGHTGISITSDGNSIVTGELFARSSVWVSPDLKPENAKQIMPATGDTWGLDWTPDGRIVYASDQTGSVEIWIMNADGSAARPLTSDKVFKLVPTVSPDGRYIVYTAASNGGELIRIDIGGGDPRVLTKSNGADNPHISPDGKWVIYSAFVDGAMRVLRVPIDGGDGQKLTSGGFATEPRYSNDGSRFACFLLDLKSLVWNKIAIYPAEGGEPITILDVPGDTNSGRGPEWTPDDKNIVVVIAPGETQELFQIPVDGSAGKQITKVGVPGIARRAFSPDGKRIAIVRAEGFGNAIIISNFR
jgi:Tol biopolymer transport system component